MLRLWHTEACLLQHEEVSSFAAEAGQESTQLACTVTRVLPAAQMVKGQGRQRVGWKRAGEGQGRLSTVFAWNRNSVRVRSCLPNCHTFRESSSVHFRQYKNERETEPSVLKWLKEASTSTVPEDRLKVEDKRAGYVCPSAQSSPALWTRQERPLSWALLLEGSALVLLQPHSFPRREESSRPRGCTHLETVSPFRTLKFPIQMAPSWLQGM